jgi:hypothetical protein
MENWNGSDTGGVSVRGTRQSQQKTERDLLLRTRTHGRSHGRRYNLDLKNARSKETRAIKKVLASVRSNPIKNYFAPV